MSLPDDDTLPLGMRQATFRKFEHIFADLLISYPAPLFVQPAGSVDSFINTIRLAAKSFLIYHWPSTTVDHSRFVTVWSSVKVSSISNQVVIQPRASFVDKSSAPVASSRPQPITLNSDDHPINVLLALMILHHHNLLPVPSEVSYPHTDILRAEAYATKHKLNIAFTRDGTTFLLS